MHLILPSATAVALTPIEEAAATKSGIARDVDRSFSGGLRTSSLSSSSTRRECRLSKLPSSASFEGSNIIGGTVRAIDWPDALGVLGCQRQQSCVPDRTSSLGGLCEDARAQKAGAFLPEERKTSAAAMSWQDRRRLLNCGPSCTELCDCRDSIVSYFADCAPELDGVCRTDSIADCFGEDWAEFYEELYCPLATCYLEGGKAGDCWCEYTVKYCEMYADYVGYDEEVTETCGVLDCCANAEMSERKMECWGEQGETAWPTPDGGDIDIDFGPGSDTENARPTNRPSKNPTQEPTKGSTKQPSKGPTKDPTKGPTQQPTKEPTEEPTEEPMKDTTEEQTEEPTRWWWWEPTEEPTKEPTGEVTEEPTNEPTKQTTKQPTKEPTKEPTNKPTIQPTMHPSKDPTQDPTKQPRKEPSNDPTKQPTKEPSNDPTKQPTKEPTKNPSKSPTIEAALGSIDRCGDLICSETENPRTCPSDCKATPFKTRMDFDHSSNGQLFTILARKDLTVFSFDVVGKKGGESDCFVLTRPGGYHRHEKDLIDDGSWQRVLDRRVRLVQRVRSNIGALDEEVHIARGSTQAFYVYCDDKILTDKAKNEGSPFDGNDALVIHEGKGTDKDHKVTSTQQFRGWIRYYASASKN